MLKTACIYEKAFDKFEEQELAFRADLGEVPDFLDWQVVNKIMQLLEHFYEMTLRISGSQYVTSNSLFTEISDLYCMLSDWKECSDNSVVLMGINMQSKFDKYWGDPQKMNFLIFFANILDPTCKLEYIEFSLS